jgi:hypothetical protein
MAHFLILIFLFLLVPIGFAFAFGEVHNFSTDKSLYHKGDQLNISGNVSYDPDVPFVTIQIFTPGKLNFADFNTVSANSDGSFSTTFHVGGPTWTVDGVYPIKVTYAGSLEESVEYKEFSETTTPSNPEPEVSATPSNPEPKSIIISEPTSNFTTLKFKIPNFPSLDKSPQYYIDRYNNEHSYKTWFDSQFPHDSIYNVLGYVDPVSVPDWIRNNAEWWAIGEITDSDFVSGIEFMLENNIIMVSNVPSSGNVSTEEIPVWVRNNAHWWSQDLISEDEFVNSLKFLIQEGIIVIN